MKIKDRLEEINEYYKKFKDDSFRELREFEGNTTEERIMHYEGIMRANAMNLIRELNDYLKALEG